MPTFPIITGIRNKTSAQSLITSPSLRIRNLTGSPLELKLLETYRAALPGGSSSFLPFHRSTLTPSSPSIAEHSESFSCRPSHLDLAPFTVTRTDINLKDGETFRLTFSVGEEKYRIDCPTCRGLSQILQPLVPNPKYQFTAVFLQQCALLCIYTTANLNSWMRPLHNATPLSALSIPGTHNSPTYHKALPSVRCQNVSPTVQLTNGVRFLDIRVQPESRTSSRLILVHSVFSVSLASTKYFHDLESDIIAFLDANPSETVLISLKREGTGQWEGYDLAETLLKHHFSSPAPHAARWYTDPRIPTLGAVRGKIVLVRRYGLPPAQQDLNDGAGLGIDASTWGDNSACSTHDAVCVQDFYEMLSSSSIKTKLQYIAEHFERAGAAIAALPGITTDKDNPEPARPFFVNFLSASNFWKRECWPENIAKIVNPEVVKFVVEKHHVQGTFQKDKQDDKAEWKEDEEVVILEKPGDGGTGIVVCDWVGANGDWDLVKCIIGCNSRLMVREMELIG